MAIFDIFVEGVLFDGQKMGPVPVPIPLRVDLNPLACFFSEVISNPIFAFREFSYQSGNFFRPDPQIEPRKWVWG